MPSSSQMVGCTWGGVGVSSMGMVEISRLAGEDLGDHLAGGHAQIIVADGQGSPRHPDQILLLAADSGNTGGHRMLAMASVLEAAVLSVGR